MEKSFFAKRAVVGKDLTIKKNVTITVGSEGRIKEILSEGSADRTREFRHSLLVPGFVNCHTHIVDAFAKEKGYGMNIEAIVAPPHGLKHRLLSSTLKKTKVGALGNAISEILSSGTTEFIDFREGGKEGVKLLAEIVDKHPIRARILGRPLNDVEVEELLEVSDGIGLSSINPLSDKRLERIRRKTHSNAKMIAYHASETAELRNESLRLHGKSDIIRGVARLSPSFIVHATHATEEDVTYLANHDTPVVVCPRSNAYLGVGNPPIRTLVQENVTLCLGTDNLMLNAPNLFREFDFLVRIARLQGITVHPRTLLKMVTVNPSRFLEENHYLAEGTRADFFLFDLEKSNVKGVDDLLHALILRGSKVNVRSVYIRGERVWR